jgi:hypothetical protein
MNRRNGVVFQLHRFPCVGVGGGEGGDVALPAVRRIKRPYCKMLHRVLVLMGMRDIEILEISHCRLIRNSSKDIVWETELSEYE